MLRSSQHSSDACEKLENIGGDDIQIHGDGTDNETQNTALHWRCVNASRRLNSKQRYFFTDELGERGTDVYEWTLNALSIGC